MIGTIVQMVVATAVVVGLIIVMGRFASKKQNGSSGIFDMVGYRSLGPKKGVAAMRVGGDVLILGVTATDLRLLGKYRAGDLLSVVPQQEPTHGAPSSGIAEKVRKLRQIKESLDG